jgi:hypothetical protein
VGYSKAVGLDMIEWLEQDLVDIIVAAGGFQLQPWSVTVEMAQSYDVPVYACLCSHRVPKKDVRVWRGEALHAWEAGVSGIYTFNEFNPHDEIFQELGDAALLRRLPRVDTYELGPKNVDHVNSLSGYLKDGERFFNKEIMLRWRRPHPESLRIGVNEE